MNKQPALKAQTRQNLIDAFWALYEQKRIEKITVKEIAQKAGYNRGTFYEYFVDVYDLLEQIEQALIPTAESLPPVRLAGQDMGMPLDAFLRLYEQNRKYYAVLLGDNGDPAFAGKLKEATKPIIRQAFTGKSAEDDEKLEYMLEYVLSAMIGTMSFWIRREKPMASADLVHVLKDLTENGAKAMLERQAGTDSGLPID